MNADHMIDWKKTAAEIQDDYAAVCRKRDELLAALEGLHKVCEIALSGKDGKQHAYFETRSGHFVEATKAMQEAEAAIAGAKGRADAPADIDDGFVGRLDDAITEALGDAMDCTRVWSAWRHGTMEEDDFALVADDPARVMEIRDAVLQVVRATKKCACVQQSVESETQASLTRDDETQTSIPAIVFYPAGSLGEAVEESGSHGA